MVAKAADWLLSIQNPDGGWGEDCESYALDYRAYQPFASTASQTAWALLGLMAAGEVDHPSCARGVAFLLALDSLVDFFAMYGDRLRRIDANAHLVALHAQNGNGNVVSDHDRLAHPSSQNQHLVLLPEFTAIRIG